MNWFGHNSFVLEDPSFKPICICLYTAGLVLGVVACVILAMAPDLEEAEEDAEEEQYVLYESMSSGPSRRSTATPRRRTST